MLLAVALSCPAQTLPDGPGKDLVDVICTACHDANRIIAKQGTKADWQAKVLEMLQECPDVSQEERETIVNYLARSFPKHVNVNAAAAREIEAVLEISAEEAEAVVSYRMANGNFKTLDDLKKVPGLAAARIDARRVEF